MEHVPCCSLAGHSSSHLTHSCQITCCSRALCVAGVTSPCVVIPFWSVPFLQLSLSAAPANKAPVQRKSKGQTKLRCTARGSNGGSGSREVEKRVPPGSIHEWRQSNASGWHAAMSGTSEEDGWCTSFGIKLKSSDYSENIF